MVTKILLRADTFRLDKQDVRYVLVTSLEVRNRGKLLSELRVDEVMPFVYEVHTIRIADGGRIALDERQEGRERCEGE